MYYRASYSRRLSPGVAGCVMSIVGIVLLAVGVLFAIDTLNFLSGALSTQGVITACHFDDSKNNTNCNPDVSFRTQSGQLINFRSSTSSNLFH